MIYCSNIVEAEALVRKILPDLTDVEFELPPQGAQNFVLIHDQQVIRVARHEWAAKTMERETKILRLLEANSPVSIPRFLDMLPDYHMMRITRVAGRHLSAEEIQRLSEKEMQNIAGQLADFMAYIHEGLLLSDEQKATFRYDPSYFHELVFPRIAMLLTQDLSKDQKELLEKAKCYIEDYDLISDDIVLTHGDLTFGNILYDDKTNKIGIVDFTGSSMSYRHLDFKKLLSYPKSFLRSVLTAYKDKTGHDVDIELTKTAYCLNGLNNWDPELKQRPQFVL